MSDKPFHERQITDAHINAICVEWAARIGEKVVNSLDDSEDSREKILFVIEHIGKALLNIVHRSNGEPELI